MIQSNVGFISDSSSATLEGVFNSFFKSSRSKWTFAFSAACLLGWPRCLLELEKLRGLRHVQRDSSSQKAFRSRTLPLPLPLPLPLVQF